VEDRLDPTVRRHLRPPGSRLTDHRPQGPTEDRQWKTRTDRRLAHAQSRPSRSSHPPTGTTKIDGGSRFSQGTGDAFFVFGSTGTRLVGLGIYRSGKGQIVCGNQPISHLNMQLVAEATATQVRIKDGGMVIRSCAKPTS
jgi:hypothetical protein